MKKCIYSLYFILLLTFSDQTLGNTDTHDVVIATIGDNISITKQELINYGRSLPHLVAYLGIPGGPMRILDDMIKQQLLVLEGKRLGMDQPDLTNIGGNTGLAISVRLRLAPRCSQPDDNTVKAYYLAHPEMFSTPLLLNLNRFGLSFTPENEAYVFNKMSSIKDKLLKGEITFLTIASESDDEIDRARHGNIGFISADDMRNPIIQELTNSLPKQIVGPVKQKNRLYLYQVIDRREPLLAPYESNIKQDVANMQQEECYQTRVDDMFTTLKQRWPVKILIEDIGIHPDSVVPSQ